MQKRAACKESHPNLWDISSAGHISAGDDSLISAVRELQEELGLTVPEENFQLKSQTKQQFVLHDGKYIDNELVDIYLVQMDVDLSTLKLQVEEVSDVKYVHWTELKRMVQNKDPAIVPGDYKEILSICEKQFAN
eukprot:TRINITY_DN3758_c0_g1_i1.p1 TRINITY_DN3758_c0_g1~~TRINITY_DN3758_c0_g1_i1.p1  ORF type:complete len:135 (+),score=16.87 TRINITY_DN3758_c0_g1_i1:106-510(+)